MNILLIQTKRIGDVIMTTPAVRALRETYPDAKIDFLTEFPSADVFRHNPYINELIIIKPLSSYFSVIAIGLKLRKKRYDIVIDFYCHLMTGTIALLTGAKRRISADRKGRFLSYNETLSALESKPYAANHKMQLLKNLVDIKKFEEDVALDFYISDEDRKYAENLFTELNITNNDKLITMSVVSRREYRRYPLDYFAKIADELIDKIDAKILILYGPNEDVYADKVRSLMRNKTLDDRKIFSLAKQRSVIERASLHIGNDNGIFHIAVSTKIKVIVFFAKQCSVNWVPANSAERIIVFEHEMECRNRCVYPKCEHECLTRTTPEMVVDKSIGILSKAK